MASLIGRKAIALAAEAAAASLLDEIIGDAVAIGRKAYGIESFARSIRANVRGLWRGVLDEGDFLDTMQSTLRRGYGAAWREGAEACGVAPQEFTDEEQAELQGLIDTDLDYAPGFADDLVANSREEGAQLAPHLARAELWVNGYNRVRARAQQLACADQKLEWHWNPLKEHCGDCRNLNGRVYRASTWERYGIQPQSHLLACGGFRCGCEFRITRRALTPGRPPTLRGT